MENKYILNNENKKNFEEPTIEVIEINEDVIITSGRMNQWGFIQDDDELE